MKSLKLSPFAEKLTFFDHFLSFFPSEAMLCKAKKPTNDQKMSNFRQNAEGLNHFYI